MDMGNSYSYKKKQIIGAGLSMVASTYGLSRYIIGLFIPNIKVDFGLSIEMMGAIVSLSYLAYLLATIIGGVLSFRVGPRYLIIAGGLCASIGLITISLSLNIYLLIIGIIVAGMSPGFAYPPLSDAIVLMIEQADRDNVYTIINSGTSIGVIISAPIAIFSANNWREAWLFFAIIAMGSTIWNAVIITRQNIQNKSKIFIKISASWLLNKNSYRLFFYSFFLGIVTSVYWTFSVDFIVSSNSYIYLFNKQISDTLFSKLFWSLVGISGLFGSFASFFVKKVGIKKMTQIGMLLISLSILLLVLCYNNSFFLLLSSFIFGGVFISTTAFVGIWSINIFFDRPAIGFGISFFLLSLGQLIGPITFGWIAGCIGLTSIFYITACVGVICSFIRANDDIYSMSSATIRS